MDFALTPEQTALRTQIIEFARKRLDPDVRARDRAHTFDRDGFRAAAEMGLLGLAIPPEYGGLGLDCTSSMIAMEALGYASPDQGLAFAINTQLWTCALPILRFGTEAQRVHWLPRLVSGEVIGGHASTEPDAGSDVFAMSTRAEPLDGGRWRLTGSKTFVSNGPIADVLIIFARTGQKKGFGAGITAFLLDLTRPGVSRGRPIEKLGLRTAPLGELHLDEVVVDDADRLGQVGAGQAVFGSEMEWERSCLFACHLGAMERQLEQAIEHARTRKQFGQAIGDFQAVSHRLAEMKVRIEVGRQMLYKVAWMKDTGQRATLESAIAKLFVSEAYVASSLDAVRTFGGYGFTAEYDAERMLRDAVGSVLYSGTSDVQRNIIARWLGL